MVITLCGSTRFKQEFEQASRELTLAGHIVLMPGIFAHTDGIELTEENKIQLDNLHRQKINMSDMIFVINKGGYIGPSTYGEIDWANKMGKKISFLEALPGERENSPEEINEPVEEKKEQI